MKIPDKPIQTVFIEASGDPPVGIPRSTYQAEIWIDPKCLNELELINYLGFVRRQFQELYGGMVDEKVSVLFDFEVDAINEVADRAEEQSS